MSRVRCRLIVAILLLGSSLPAPAAASGSWDGITIISLAGPNRHFQGATHIVTFVSDDATYAAEVRDDRAGRTSCAANAVPGSQQDDNISFGVETSLRRGSYLLCKRFTLRLEGDGKVRVRTGEGYDERHSIVARIPRTTIDFDAGPFAKHDFGGVHIGPVAGDGVNERLSVGQSYSYTYKSFYKVVGGKGSRSNVVRGRVAPAEITGWPRDVLYTADYTRHYGELVTLPAFREALFRQYGQPSSAARDGKYWLWLYDLDGRPVKPGTGDGSCAVTADYWLKYIPDGPVDSVRVPSNKNDLGAWGCLLIVEVNARGGSGGVNRYTAKATSGYAMAVTHFRQRAREVAVLMQGAGTKEPDGLPDSAAALAVHGPSPIPMRRN